MWLKQQLSTGKLGLLWALLAIGLLWALHIAPAQAAAPLAGTIITNQATASYTENNVVRTVTSNTVETRVTEKRGLALTQDNTKSVAPGGTVYFPHTVTNTGNASDSFNLRISGLTGNTAAFAGSCSIFADANGDGQPDNPSSPLTTTGSCANAFATGMALTTGPVAAGQPYHFVVALQALSTAADTNTVNMKVDAQSVGDTTISTTGFGGTATGQNTDTVKIANTAVFEVVKSVDKTTAAAGDVLTYTLTVKNIGAAVGSTTIEDVIGTGDTASLTYIAASGRWSSTGTTALTDASGTAETGSPDGTGTSLDYGFASNKVTAVFSNMPRNTTQTITFQVTVNAAAAAGTVGSKNAANYTSPGTCAALPGCKTNTVITTINASYGVTANASTATLSTQGKDSPTGTPLVSADDTNKWTSISANAGSTVSFNNQIWNTGNTPDSWAPRTTSKKLQQSAFERD